jgi:high-affinity Fe2+/Pb2+ permease
LDGRADEDFPSCAFRSYFDYVQLFNLVLIALLGYGLYARAFVHSKGKRAGMAFFILLYIVVYFAFKYAYRYTTYFQSLYLEKFYFTSLLVAG